MRTSPDVVTWAKQLDDALKFRAAIQRELNEIADQLRQAPDQVDVSHIKGLLDHIREANARVGELTQALQDAGADYVEFVGDVLVLRVS